MKRESIIQGFPICVALLIFVVLTTGCVGPTVRTYSGNKLQKSEVAVIKGRYYSFPLFWFENIDIHRFDHSIVDTTEVEALPGWHELVVTRYSIKLFPSDVECARAAFSFEAGHEYRIKSPFFSHRMEIIDVNTGITIFTQTWLPCREFPGF
jgi:hypothetical protein